MALERKKTLNVFKDAAHASGSYDEFPVGPVGTDPMPHLSRNRVPQPFFVVNAADQVLIQMAGRGELQLRDVEPARMQLVPGDAVYIPAGVPSRVIPDGEVLQIRLKAEPPAKEAVAWYCAACGALVHTRELSDAIVQEGYWRALHEFNGDAQLRTCGGCQTVHPPAELGDIAWPEVAAALRADGG
jgi:3-hydroxyanthranilate 3,4-dioxygenase